MSGSLPRRDRRNDDSSSSSLAIHNVVVAGHRTSVRLEPVMWEALQDIARQQRVSVHDVVTAISQQRSESSLTAAIRVYIVNYYRAAAVVRGQPAPEHPSRWHA